MKKRPNMAITVKDLTGINSQHKKAQLENIVALFLMRILFQQGAIYI